MSEWEGLLVGAERDQALEAVDDIARALTTMQFGDVDGPGLGKGAAGIALCLAEIAGSSGSSVFGTAAARHLDDAIAVASETPLAPSLYLGLPGIALALSMLDESLSEDALDDADEALANSLVAVDDERPFSLMRGYAGLTAYALRRRGRPAGGRIIQGVVASLAATALSVEAGVFWRTPPALIDRATRAEFPNGYVAVGMAEGVAGLLACLARLERADAADQTATELAQRAAHWLLAQRLPREAPRAFPDFLATEVQRAPSRSSWCTGDEGICLALLAAADAMHRPDWAAVALDIARRATQRPEGETRVMDACLCHGAAGLAHFFNRLYQRTKDSLYADAARRWLSRTLAMRAPRDQGVAGYSMWRHGRWRADAGLVNGAAGVALCLSSATCVVEPTWDTVMFFDASSCA